MNDFEKAIRNAKPRPVEESRVSPWVLAVVIAVFGAFLVAYAANIATDPSCYSADGAAACYEE